MNIFLFFDGVPVGPVIGLFGAAVFFLICIAIAIAVFLLLRKTLKMAFRIGIVAVILLIAIVGGIACVYLGLLSSSESRPGPPRPSPTRKP